MDFELLEFIKKHMYLEIMDAVVSIGDNEPVNLAYCINYQGHVYRLHQRYYFSLVSDKAQLLANLIINGKSEGSQNDV